MLVYSVTDEGSFSYADHLLQTISQLQTNHPHHHHPPRPVILLANKADLEQPARKVGTGEGQALSCRYSSLGCSFFEVAAAGEAYHEIVHAFRVLIRQSKAAIVEQLFEVLDCSDKRSNSSNGSSSSLKVTRIFGQMLARMGKKSSTTTGTATELTTSTKPTKKMKKKKQKSLSI